MMLMFEVKPVVDVNVLDWAQNKKAHTTKQDGYKQEAIKVAFQR